jgi:hypothetical protein
MVVPRLWVSMEITSQATGKSKKALYEQIRSGIFPFEYRRAGKSILVSARDLGLVPSNNEKSDDKSQTEPQSASAAA